MERTLQQYYRLFLRKHFELRCAASVSFPPGGLCIDEFALLPMEERHDGWRVPVWPAREFQRRLELQRLQDTVLGQIQLLKDPCLLADDRYGSARAIATTVYEKELHPCLQSESLQHF